MSPPAARRKAEHAASAGDLALVAASVRLLFANGETTHSMVLAVTRLADALGFRVTVLPRWGEVTLRIDDATGSRVEIITVAPLGVDMSKVAETIRVIDEVCGFRAQPAAARAALETVAASPPVSVARFAVMAAAGAAALGVIFGAAHLLSLVLIALSAGTGACLRRWLAARSRNPFVQPFCAALLAGVVGAVVVRLQLGSVLRLVAVCPCMVLVPGPHLLNGTIDLGRARIALGASRVLYAGLVILAISAGLLTGLALGGVDLPVSGPSTEVPLGYDVIAAGVAVAAYGTFFAMPWRQLPIPILIGMAAHASRWEILAQLGVSAQAGAFIACVLVGTVVTVIADRLRLPFAAFAFASVVSLIPGVFLFRMAGGLVGLVAGGGPASADLLAGVISDGTTAALIVMAMTIGLIVPKIGIEHLWPRLTEPG